MGMLPRTLPPIAAVAMAATVLSARPVSGQDDQPKWLTGQTYDRYAGEDRVLLPWTPVEYDDPCIRVWGRILRWSPESLLPSSITSQGTELLAEPMALVLTLDGEDYRVPLDRLAVAELRRKRVSVVAVGEAKGVSARANMWVEYDGFLWVTLRLRDSRPGRSVDALRVTVKLPSEEATLYQTFARPLAGWTGDQRIEIPWLAKAKEHIANFYHWLGNEDRGLGFTYATLEHWAPRSEESFCTIEPRGDVVLYRANLIEQPVALDGRQFRFGVQATPIKPLPPDYHSMVSTRLDWHEWAAWQHMLENVDSVVIWPPGKMEGLNDPYNVDRDAMTGQVAYVHDRGIGALFTGCPQKVSPLSAEFDQYRDEWLCLPESILDWEGVPHYQNCGRSPALRKWLFHGWAIEIVQRFGLEGIYYDGWQTGQIACSNDRHGCGWTGADGERHVTVPVLEGREYNQVMAAFLEDHVNSPYAVPETAPERPDFPRYHYRVHSWEFAPSVMGFATSWLTGEFAAYPLQGTSTLKPEGTFGKCLGMGLFRSRCLSTNWGVPNLFHTLMWEHTENHPTDRQTIMAYAWFLPHGVPVGELRYMNQGTVRDIYRVLMAYETRGARFTPAWRPNPYLEVVEPSEPEVVVATWDHESRKRVLGVVSNLRTDTAAHITLRWTAAWAPKVANARTGETVAVIDNALSLHLEPETFVLLGIEGR